MRDPAVVADHLNAHPLLLAGIIASHEESLRKQGVVLRVKPSAFINQVSSGAISFAYDLFDTHVMNALDRLVYSIVIAMITDSVDQPFIRIDEDSINFIISKYFLESLERDVSPYDYDAVSQWHIDNGVLYVTSVELIRSIEPN